MDERLKVYCGMLTSIEPELEEIYDSFSIGFSPEDERLAGLLVPIKYEFDGEDDLAKISAREISRRLDGKSEGIRVEVCVDRKIDITGEHESGGNTNQYEGVGLIKFLRG